MVMSRVVITGLIIVSINVVVYVILIMAMHYGPLLNIKIYPGYIVAAAAALPLFYGKPAAKFLLSFKRKFLSWSEVLVFGLVAVGGTSVASYFTEAIISYNLLSQFEAPSFYEVIQNPFGGGYRLSIPLYFYLSFFTSATLVIAFVCLIRIPMLVQVLHVKSQTKPPNQQELQDQYRAHE